RPATCKQHEVRKTAQELRKKPALAQRPEENAPRKHNGQGDRSRDECRSFCKRSAAHPFGREIPRQMISLRDGVSGPVFLLVVNNNPRRQIERMTAPGELAVRERLEQSLPERR